MNSESPGPNPDEIKEPVEAENNAAEVVQGLRDRIEDPEELRNFSKEHDMNSGKWGSGATEALEAYHEKYSHWPGEEEEYRQIKEYLSEGEGGRWQEKTLQRYRELYPEGAINPDKWEETVLLVRDTLRMARLEQYKFHKGWSEDEKNHEESTEVPKKAEKIGLIRANGETRGKDESNRDAILVNTEKNIYGVFDGVGHEMGSAEASNKAAELIGEEMGEDEKYSSVEEVQADLKQVLESVNQELFNIGSTTATVAKIWKHDGKGFLVFANSGDSRLYLLREGENLRLLTIDDNLISQAVEDGELTLQQADIIDQADSADTFVEGYMQLLFNRRNIITSHLGNDRARVKTGIFQLSQGDKIAITTDGIHDNLPRTRIQEILSVSTEPFRIIETSLEYSQQRHFRSKRDDMSAVVIEIPTEMENK